MTNNLEETIRNKYQVLFQLNNEITELAGKHFNTFTAPEKSRKNDILMGLLAKSIRSHSATIILCSLGYGMEADSIVRSMFEDFVNMRYILNEKKRETRARRYIEHIKIQQYHMLEYAKGKKRFKKYEFPSEEYLKYLQATNAFNKRYKNTKKKYLWSGYHLSELCRKIGHSWEYDVYYNLASQHGHSQPITLNQLVSEKNDRTLTFSGGPQVQGQDFNLIGAFDMLHRMIEMAANHFGKQDLEIELTKMGKNLNECVARLNSGK